MAKKKKKVDLDVPVYSKEGVVIYVPGTRTYTREYRVKYPDKVKE